MSSWMMDHRRSRRGLLWTSAAFLAGWPMSNAVAAPVLRLGVPQDVADDYQQFLSGRELSAITHFGGPHARRDVMELTWLLREIQRQPDAPQVVLVRIDSYERLLVQLRGGHIDLIGTSAWLSDIQALVREHAVISDALVPQGRFVVGVYTSRRNVAALKARSLADLRLLRFVSNSRWSQDWATLRRLQIEPRFDVKTWKQMVALVGTGRADALLAPFQPSGEAMALHASGVTLEPIRGLAVALDGSRHVASSIKSAHAGWLRDRLFPVLAAQIRSGALMQAYEECGFLHPQTRNWTVL